MDTFKYHCYGLGNGILWYFFLQWHLFQKHTLANHAANLYETIDFPFGAFFWHIKSNI